MIPSVSGWEFSGSLSFKDPPFFFSWNLNLYFFLKTLKSFFWASLLVFFCGSVRADDGGEDFVEPYIEPLVLDSSGMQAVTNLARAISGVNATTATVDDNVASILALLSAWNQAASSGAMIRSYPIATVGGASIGTILGHGLFTTWNGNRPPATTQSYLYQLQRAIYGNAGVPPDDDAVIPILLRLEALLSSSSDSYNDSNVVVRLESLMNDINFISTESANLDFIQRDVYDLDANVDTILQNVAGLSATFSPTRYDANRLLVYDMPVESAIQALRSELNAIPFGWTGDFLSTGTVHVSSANLERIEEAMTTIVARVELMESVDQSSDRLAEDIYDDVQDIQTDYSDEESELEDTPLPSATSDYTPSISMTDDQQTDLGLDQTLPNRHNALIVLHRGSRSASYDPSQLPTVEIDWGSNSSMQNAASQFSSLFSWLYGVLFTLLLSVKGLVMFRKCRLATTAMAVDEKALPIHLAFDPF